MGGGAGVVVVEEYEHAKARGAKIYAEVIGYGLSGDAYHVTAPHPEGSGAYRAMEMAMRKSGLSLDDIDYINAHGTSTPLGDELELGAVRRLFGDAIGNLSMSSTKSARSEEHTSELQSLMRISYAVFCLKKKTKKK